MDIRECCIRASIALLLGYLIGLERKLRYSDAGPRTHAFVSFGSCLFMLVSIFGFGNESHDASRVASTIVTGVSFLGAGNIVYNKENSSLHGLTTAAGLWLTAAIGMIVGTGNIIFGGCATAIVLIFQILSHIPIKALSNRTKYTVYVTYIDKGVDIIKETIKYDHVVNCKYIRESNDLICHTTIVIFGFKQSINDIVKPLRQKEEVLSIEFKSSK